MDVRIIELDLVDDNPFNSRSLYQTDKIYALSRSFVEIGLLTKIKVRQKDQRYEIVYGHRRVRAARALGWRTIEAECDHFTDAEMATLSFAENSEREDLSDFERAQTLRRMQDKLSMKLGEISQLTGLSTSHICNYIRMTHLVDSEVLLRDPTLLSDLYKLDEHHARVLLQIPEQDDRISAIRLASSQSLSVRELERIVHKLRSWFRAQSDSFDSGRQCESEISSDESQISDEEQIQRAIFDEWESVRKCDFERFARVHDFEDGFSLYVTDPRFELLSDSKAMKRELHWFKSHSWKFRSRVSNLKVRVLGDVAYATFCVYLKNGREPIGFHSAERGTVIFHRVRSGRWKIIHEHWSPMTHAREERVFT